MEYTREETAQRALRLIGVVAADEPPTADEMAAALVVLDSIWAEAMDEARADWDIATGIPSDGFVPLAQMLGAELAGEYAVQSPMSRARAKLRLMAVIRRTQQGACCAHEDYGMCLDGPQPTPVTHGVWDDNANWSED
ncbi:hypothetical protein RM190_04915 [Paracoccus sp. CPCC 101403]|uniref:Uncharacterized protein n=1 Tax=Paracoccus broussonetiae TaxID=3075834 RepID=A0ABU3ECI8_9RHOB|nr:hypothetical protein [Paracoccus sp. CPCC 101403]MDT1061190.1 hypothetical protein [Paracoccus sp. CPCC 101403]